MTLLTPSIGDSIDRVAGIAAIDLSWLRLPDVSRYHPWWWVAALVAAWLVLTPVAIYVALADD